MSYGNLHHGSDVLSVSELCPQDAAVKCTGKYVVTQKDMDNGKIHGKGKVRCVDREGSSKVAEDEIRIVLAGTASVSLGQCLPFLEPTLLKYTITGI